MGTDLTKTGNSMSLDISKREQRLITIICEPVKSSLLQIEVGQRFRWQPDGAVCVKVDENRWVMAVAKPHVFDAPKGRGWRVFPICDLEILRDKDRQDIYHINWATKNVLFWLHNEEGIYSRMAAKRPFIVDSAREFCLGAFPDGTPEMLDDIANEMESVDWSDISAILNES